ncbi:MAG TPA: CHASE2 domain-containing protein [Cytophagaceae bacterium]|jgi:CHASE2 domain-containing sensor protein|nr:CHASE2 domain-containing protein [Cytophagaceae bacterium]
MKIKGFIWDALGTTIFGVIFLWGVSKIDINLDIINPISKTLEDFELTDVVFSQLRESPPVNNDIVLVNIGNLDRAGIAAEIEIINKYNPKVIGIDAFFRKPKHSPDPLQDSLLIAGDSALARAFKKVKYLVLGCELHENEEKEMIDSISLSHPMFRTNSHTAYLDMISEGKNTFKTARHCFLKQKIGDSTILSFPTLMAKVYKPESVAKLDSRNNETETINYIGNVNTVTKDHTPNSKITFTALDVDQVLNEQFEPEVFKDKVVIMGFMGPNFETYSTEDRFFTPLNKNYVGRASEDMFGVVVHANICAMILSGNYINEMPKSWSQVINVIIVFLNILLFTYFYFKLELFWDGITLIITLVEALLFTTVIVYIFDFYDYKLDFTMSTVALFLMPNIIELYYGLIKSSELKLRSKFSKTPDKDKIIVKTIDDDE